MPTHFWRYIFWNNADINDYKRFPAYSINRGPDTYNFIEAGDQLSINLPEDYQRKKTYSNFPSFLEDKKTTAFIIIRNDSILYENYFSGFSRNSIVSSFSISKSFISALTGIAISEGKIRSADQTVGEYLTGFKHPGFEKIRIEDLLNMRSGINYKEEYYNPFGDMAKFYYGVNLEKYVYDASIKEPPGLHYDYVSINAQIMAMILEKGTGMKVSEYLQEKIWKKLGMESDALWNMDCKKNGMVKAFCCLNARPLDFARFGRLYLHRGNWNGNQIVPEEWIEHTMRADENFKDAEGYPYSLFWRVLEDGSFFAKGIMGQYIYMMPEKNLIFLRFGKSYGDVDWVKFFREISNQL